MGDDTEWLKLPADDKCVHKVWKARVAGYEEATKLFNSQTDEKSPEFSKYLGLVKKFVTDNNAIAQEKALDAVLAFVENAALAGRTCGEVVSGIVAKCLNSSRTKTREKALEIIMLYVEIDKPDPVQEELMKGLENKQPKIVVGCIQALREALGGFGTKVIKVKPIVKVLPKLLEDRDKNVREETKLLIIEIFRWIGPAIKPQMTHYKPVQVQELEAEFEKLGNERAVQTRFMRSQQDLRAQMEEKAAASGGTGAGDSVVNAAPVEDVDPYDLMDPVDILSALPKDFYEKIEAKKWQERREALDALHKLSETPKLQNGDYGTLVRALLKVIGKDTNVMLVTLAAKCLAGIANGLRKRFSQYATNSIQTILEKFKEKKATVVAALRECIDACYTATSLDPISEDILAALENKNPSIKAETSLFLARCFAKATTATLPKKLLKAFCGELCKKINDTAPDVREAAFTALGTAMKVVGEKPLTPFLADIDSIKLGKIKEQCEAAVLLNARGEPRGGAVATAKPAAAKAPEPKPVARPPSRSSSAKPAAGKSSKPAGSGPAKKKPAGKKDAKKGGSEEVQENILPDEVVEEKVAALLPADTVSQLASSNWKERLASMEKFTQVVKGMSRDEIPAQVFVRTICNKPGLKDTNFQVLKLRLELIAFLAKNSSFSKRSASFCLTELVDKVGDVKNGSASQEALSCIAEATGLEFVAAEVIHLAFEQKNPKNQAESLNWLANALKEFGFKIQVKPMIENIKKAFAATNPAVRTAALNLLSTLFLYMGATLRVFFDGEKAALLQQIDAEFEKLKGEKPPAPVRGLAPRGGKGDEEEEPEEEEEDAPALADLIPRTDISEKITDALLTEMGDKSWKIRAEGLQKVVSILNEAKFISANIGQLPEALKTRLGDSNKILVMTTLTICQTMGTALGPHCKGHVRIIGPGITTCMGDSKPHVRAAAVSAMNIWAENATLLPFVEAEVFSDALKLENPALRAELLGWLSEKLPPHKQLPTELKMCIPHVLSCLEDRNGDVRKKAQEALVPFMIHTGYDSFQKATSKLKPASKDQIMGIIEKARANIPAKPSKKSAAKAAPAPAAAAPPPKVEARDEDDEEVEAINAPSRPASTSGGKGKAKQGSAKSKATPTATKKKKDEEDMGPAIIINVPKEQRMKDEKALKILKWNFTEPRLEFVDQLKLQMEKNFNKPLMAQLFHADFKQHIKAIESLMKVLETDMEATAANLDVLLRWMTLRFFDTNPSMLNKALEYLRILFTALAEMDYHLTESEASSFIPYLVNKVGDPKDNVRRDVRTIFKLLCKVYPSSKMSGFMLDGLKAKNAKLRTECLEELGCLIDLYGVNVCQPSPAQALKLIAQQIGDRDNCVRSAALNTLVSAYLILGEQTYKYVGKLKDKDQSLLEERIKRSAKNKPAAAPSQPVQGQAKSNKERPKSGPPPSDRIDSVMAGIPKSASSQSVRKGAFSLEMEEEEGDFKVSDVKLIDLDFDDILKETIELPKTNRSHRSPPSNAALGSSNDAASAIGLVIAQIASTDTNAAIQALAQIDEVLKDKEKSELMLTHVDQLLLTLSMQLKMVYSKHMGDDINIGEENVMKLYRCLLGTVIEVFQNKTLARQASKDILKDLLGNLATNLLDKRLEDFEEGTQVIRTVNVTIVKIVGKSDPTTIIGAVIKLLQECVGSETCSKKYIEIIMKCLWKTIRMLPDIISEINVDRLLLDAHLFLKAFPSSYWRDRSSDIPYRTVKTVIHTLYKVVGNSILSHTGLIEQPNSEVISYLNKLLNNSKNEIMNGDNKMPQKEGKPSKRLSKSTHEDLVEIFKKIGSKENSKEGLNYLYDFKKKHPEADLEPFMRKSSQYFQQYVERGLKTIEQEREGKLTHSNAGNVLGNSNAPSVIGSSEASEGDSAAYYREKLRILRARCGMDNNAAEQENNEPVRRPNTEISENALPPVTSSERVQSEPQVREEEGESSGTSATDLLELRKRLERIKKMAS